MSREAKDLINRLLEVNPVKRLSASEALRHPWFHMEDKYKKDFNRKPNAVSLTRYSSTDSLSCAFPGKSEHEHKIKIVSAKIKNGCLVSILHWLQSK